MNSLKKLMDAVQLIEEMSAGRCVPGIGSPFIYTPDEAGFAIQMRQKEPFSFSDLTKIEFSASFRELKSPMSASDLLALSQESAQAHSLLAALEAEEIYLDKDDFHAFSELIKQRKEQEQTQNIGPVMGLNQ